MYSPSSQPQPQPQLQMDPCRYSPPHSLTKYQVEASNLQHLPSQGASSSLSSENGPRISFTHHQALSRQAEEHDLIKDAESRHDLEYDEDTPLVDWDKVLSWKSWMKMKYIPWYIAFIIISVAVVLMTLYHEEILEWLKPAATWMKDLPGGWTIPIGILFVISFPPLGGHEIIILLCGFVWGLWVGFGIVSAGTFLGEVGNFYAFRYCFQSRARKIEKKDLTYACLSHVIREGGFLIALVVRFSAIPGHFTTIVFSTCGMNIWIFSLAAALSLPKQLIIVYLGVILAQSGEKTSKSKWISRIVLVISFLVTILAAWWIWRKMKLARPAVIREWKEKERMNLVSIQPEAHPAFGSSVDSVDVMLSVAEEQEQDRYARYAQANRAQEAESRIQPGYNIEYIYPGELGKATQKPVPNKNLYSTGPHDLPVNASRVESNVPYSVGYSDPFQTGVGRDNRI
ncbi:Predicted membrane protein [Phaffia rhodozyma]|uniref:Golgi apparatus membrane protein TVP38 n=1 Tax=Phaffia rhodozyma TaxID=264483 RepID=A0A0F7SQL3_PHARH|nr:Predicted membrane protein [Phaffia rhodozyma]